jgi:hypothetical protein
MEFILPPLVIPARYVGIGNIVNGALLIIYGNKSVIMVDTYPFHLMQNFIDIVLGYMLKNIWDHHNIKLVVLKRKIGCLCGTAIFLNTPFPPHTGDLGVVDPIEFISFGSPYRHGNALTASYL